MHTDQLFQRGKIPSSMAAGEQEPVEDRGSYGVFALSKRSGRNAPVAETRWGNGGDSVWIDRKNLLPA